MLFDSPAVLAPESVLNWLALCVAGLAREEQEAYRLHNAALPLPHALNEELGVGASQADIVKHFIACRLELELTAVLTMTAAAEAKIRLDAISRIENGTDNFAKRLKFLRSRVQLPWAIPLYEDGIVDAWKTFIGSLADIPDRERAQCLNAVGCYRNLLNIRHWVAHGRYWRPKWGAERFVPADVAETIRDLYDTLRQVAIHGDVMSFA